MHKKLETDLMSLAHSVLQMKNKEDVFALKEKSKEIYEKLSVLAFVEEYVNTTPNLEETKDELTLKIEKAFEVKKTIVAPVIIENELIEENEEEPQIEEELNEDAEVVVNKTETQEENVIEQPFDELEQLIFSENPSATNFKDDVKDVGERKTLSLEEELQDTIPVDIMADLFENAQPKSLNDKLSTNIQIGLNDRIVFVKNLFDGSQEDFNRVVSQLNTFKTEKEAKKFINKMVKPDYNWTEHEELEMRFIEIIERRFA
ncbi:hypothetical protein MC378_06345 [Polaribacter sp. MSW13]|uniref:Uncharacterized protein n=1 Tax=Polaribacter marinus TaxID=2916838 RepID=A0A9X1VST1_9FLAO|nr:hypothetical protein [Polaribacter marinus]MCI2228781.1 hypothetical protein [Polaribacter marinus]